MTQNDTNHIDCSNNVTNLSLLWWRNWTVVPPGDQITK